MTLALLQRVFQEVFLPTTTATATATATGTTSTAMAWTMVVVLCESISNHVRYCIMNTLERLLLLLSLILNAYVCILFVKTWKWPQRQQKLQQERYQKRIQQILNQHSKTLTSQDFSGSNGPDNNDIEENEECICYWRVPKPGKALESREENNGAIMPQNPQQPHKSEDYDQDEDENDKDTGDDLQLQQRSVSGECVICMHEYSIGDKIAWSSNPDCIHCYHARCLQEWLVHSNANANWAGGEDHSYTYNNIHRQQNKLCPCCRQPYYPHEQGSSDCKKLQ